MNPIKADQEDQREVLRVIKILHESMVKNGLAFPYVMEALQSMYATYANRLVSYEEYCEKMEFHKRDYKRLWEKIEGL